MLSISLWNVRMAGREKQYTRTVALKEKKYHRSRSEWTNSLCVNTLRPRQNGRNFADDTLKRIFLNENVGVSNNISLKFVHKGPINNIPALVQMMAWRRPGDKPLSEPMIVRLPTHICVTRPQWVKLVWRWWFYIASSITYGNLPMDLTTVSLMLHNNPRPPHLSPVRVNYHIPVIMSDWFYRESVIVLRK